MGLGISSYLTIVHYAQGQVPLLCTTGGAVNCEQVTTSPESMIGPLPVAVFGVAWFLILLALVMLPRLGALPGAASQIWQTAQLSWSTVGLLVVLYLIYAELFLIGAICLWCSAVHVLVFVQFLAAVNDYIKNGDAIADEDEKRPPRTSRA